MGHETAREPLALPARVQNRLSLPFRTPATKATNDLIDQRDLGDPGADSGSEKKSKRAEKYMARRKVKNGEKSPWGQWALSIQQKFRFEIQEILRVQWNGSFCTVVVMSCLVNMSSDVMSYASQSGHAIYRGSRGIGLEKNLRCSLVFEQNLQF